MKIKMGIFLALAVLLVVLLTNCNTQTSQQQCENKGGKYIDLKAVNQYAFVTTGAECLKWGGSCDNLRPISSFDIGVCSNGASCWKIDIFEPTCIMPKPEGLIVGRDRDEHGCIPSAGASWCEAKQKCFQPFEETC